MKERIIKNEERLNIALDSIKDLESSLIKFKSIKNSIRLLNNYYGSKSWFRDKEEYENSKSKNIKAGVLSEDAVWNMNEDIFDLLEEMKNIVDIFSDKNIYNK